MGYAQFLQFGTLDFSKTNFSIVILQLYNVQEVLNLEGRLHHRVQSL
jgi:hypothetical protein